MKQRRLGKTELMVSSIGFGGIPIQRASQEKANEIVDQMIAEGMNFIDTAIGYTVSESYIGNALAGDKRKKFVLATKSPAKDYEGMKADIEKSLKALQTDYIDLYQCHLIRNREQYEQVMGENGAYKAMLEAKDSGKIGHIGITAHSAEFLMEVLEEMPFETIQFPYNLVERQGEKLFERAKALDLGVIIMKPMAGGAIENGTLSLRFILENSNISVVIPGMETPELVEKNAAVGHDFKPISDAEKIEIEKFVNEIGSQFCRRCGYCLPCVQGIDIPVQFIMEGYLTRYGLEAWAKERYESQAITASACIKCGACEPRCPYNLPIRDMLERVQANFLEYENSVK
ncbi:aldo/keto reductase [Fusibacter ferrireducens]|uniref:Aldo/keto reductase n=1 Tax=Fusibacter ferrireducens TaxID=2785058 RepID=A0ABR9ZY68_9FIRM|nr:aldo/keto reductase [Fusibacter ferrireducens]MBF4695413.1 aldo/keto reductase [Fusibacter ferrireducens]